MIMAERKSVAEGIRALRREILNKAQGQAKELIEAVNEEREAARQQAEEKAQAIKEEILHGVREEAAATKRRTLSAARLEAQRTLLTKREELISQVFAEAQERLRELRRSDRYPDVLRRLIVEAGAGLGGGNLVVLANKEDAVHLSEEFLAQVAEQ